MGYETESWNSPAVKNALSPIIELTRAITRSRGSQYKEEVSEDDYSHSFPVFVKEVDDTSLGSYAHKYKNDFGGKLVFDPAGLALRKAEAIHLENAVISLSLIEFLESRPFGSFKHELYHAASKDAMSKKGESPDRFWCAPQGQSLNYQLSAPGSEVFAPLLAAISSLQSATTESNPALREHLLKCAASSINEGISYCATFTTSLKAAGATLVKIEELSKENLLVLDATQATSGGKLKVEEKMDFIERIRSSPVGLRIFSTGNGGEEGYPTIQISGGNQSWRLTIACYAEPQQHVLESCTHILAAKPRMSVAEFLTSAPYRAMRSLAANQASLFLFDVLEATNLLGDLSDLIDSNKKDSRSLSAHKLQPLLERAARFYPEIQRLCL